MSYHRRPATPPPPIQADDQSLRSNRSDSSALSILAKMMRDQAALVQAMALDDTHTSVTTAPELQQQIATLQQQLSQVQSTNASLRSGHSVAGSSATGDIPTQLAVDFVPPPNNNSVPLDVNDDDELSLDDDIRSRHSSHSRRSHSSRRSQTSRGSKYSESTTKRTLRSLSSSSASSSKISKRAARNGGFEPPLPEFEREAVPQYSVGWKRCVRIFTGIVPDACVPRKGAAKQAWR